ncbi:MAG: hypothetical protein ABI647_14680 [Gemmatimonadota bacterium]
MKSRNALAFSLAVGVGAAAGWWLARRRLERHKADLFARSPYRRWSAATYLAGQESVETLHVLRDYLRWESSPRLKRRAVRLVRRMERALG